jgi:hypothetical protein
MSIRKFLNQRTAIKITVIACLSGWTFLPNISSAAAEPRGMTCITTLNPDSSEGKKYIGEETKGPEVGQEYNRKAVAAHDSTAQRKKTLTEDFNKAKSSGYVYETKDPKNCQANPDSRNDRPTLQEMKRTYKMRGVALLQCWCNQKPKDNLPAYCNGADCAPTDRSAAGHAAVNVAADVKNKFRKLIGQ